MGPRLSRMAEMSSKVLDSQSVSGASGELAEGLSRAWTMSWAKAMTVSVEEAVGIWTLEGNHSRVSQMRSCFVSQIQTL